MKAQLGLSFALMLAATPALAAGYSITNLVSNQVGVAKMQDTDLVNPWGLCQDSDADPVWTSDNGSDKSTFYNRTSGLKQFPVVAIPHGVPTGCVSVPVGINFTMTENALSGRAYFLFDSEAGAISGWAPGVDQNNAIIGYDGASKGAVYKGLALDTTNKHLLAANFAKNKVEIFDTTFAQIGSFTDADLPKKYSPFNVAVLKGAVYVAFALIGKHGVEKHGAGLGYVDVFDLGGNLQTRLISNGALNAPWGMAIAPASWGTFANALLVGNFGDGHINAYDSTSGAFLGTVGNKKGKALKIDGLWALDPGPGKSTVTFSAGPDQEANGLIGLIKPN
jgi:uncharacterized protein (TIGR03118 family)